MIYRFPDLVVLCSVSLGVLVPLGIFFVVHHVPAFLRVLHRIVRGRCSSGVGKFQENVVASSLVVLLVKHILYFWFVKLLLMS